MPIDLRENCDLDAMWSSRDTHYINFYVSSPTVLFMTVFNFDLPHRQADIKYKISIYVGLGLEPVPMCFPCANGETYLHESTENILERIYCICSNCK